MIITFPFLKRRSFKMKTTASYPADASDGRGLPWQAVREHLVLVTPKQMHLDSAQITSSNQATFRSRARWVPGIIHGVTSGSSPNAAAAQSAQGSASWHSRTGQACARRALDPNAHLAGRACDDWTRKCSDRDPSRSWRASACVRARPSASGRNKTGRGPPRHFYVII